jgi:hypothetical protein
MAGETPKTTKYDQPTSGIFGDIYRNSSEQLGITRPFYLGPLDNGAMGRSPLQLYLGAPDADVTPQANPAAVRAYTRNAPYMEEFMSDPQTMMGEIMRLRQAVAEKPGDPVNEYRLRVLQGALRDVFGMGEKDGRASAMSTPSSDYTPTTPKGYRY